MKESMSEIGIHSPLKDLSGSAFHRQVTYRVHYEAELTIIHPHLPLRTTAIVTLSDADSRLSPSLIMKPPHAIYASTPASKVRVVPLKSEHPHNTDLLYTFRSSPLLQKKNSKDFVGIKDPPQSDPYLFHITPHSNILQSSS